MGQSLEIETDDPVKIIGANSTHAEPGAHVNVNRIDISDRTVSVVAIAISVLAVGMSMVAMNLCRIAEREARLAQQDAMLLKASLVAHGISYNEDQLHRKDR